MDLKNEKLFHQLIWYMLIFSIFGLIIETTYCFITTGVLESRKGLILGPVCPIYGIGAVIIILGLRKFKGKKIQLFLLGIILGSIAEYAISFMLEAIYGTRFWEYSYMKYHINGRICVVYSLFWGILSLIMIQYVKPLIDKIIDKIQIKWLDYTILLLFIIDALLTVWGINVYIERVKYGRQEPVNANFIQINKYKIEEKCFSNETISKIFPNIRIIDDEGQEVWVRDLIKKHE